MNEELLHDFLKAFENEPGEPIIHVDLSNLKGAYIIGDDVKIYSLCIFLGIRPTATTSEDFIDNAQSLLDTLNEDCVNILIIHNICLSTDIDIQQIKDYAKSIGKVFFVYDRDRNSELLREVNKFRINDPTFC